MSESPKFKIKEEVTGVAFDRYTDEKLGKLLNLVDNCNIDQMNDLAVHISKSKSVNPSGKRFMHLSSLEESIARRKHELQNLIPKIQRVQEMYKQVSEDMSLTQKKRESLQKQLKIKFSVLAKRFNVVNEADLIEIPTNKLDKCGCDNEHEHTHEDKHEHTHEDSTE